MQITPQPLFDRNSSLLPAIVERLDTDLITPHFDIIVQDEAYSEASLFYYIGKGECKVRVRDNVGREKIVSTLEEGDHFGEISIIYECKRNATVTSMNYNTFATMQSDLLQSLIKDYPEYEICLKRNIIQNYNDDQINFRLKMLKEIDYFSQAPNDVLYEIMFSL